MTTETADVRGEPLPCPFCGGEAIAIPDTSYGEARVICPDNNDCPVQPIVGVEFSKGLNVADAIAAWNTRTPAPEAIRDEPAVPENKEK